MVDAWVAKPNSSIDQAELDDVRRYVCQYMCPANKNTCKGPDATPVKLLRDFYTDFGNCLR